MTYNAAFSENEYYHVFNRANGNELLFRNEDNYDFFLKKIKKCILPVADLYAYCLLPIHYHLVLQLKPSTDVESHYAILKKKAPPPGEWYAGFITQCFGNCQNSYAKSFNKYYSRMGSLFMSPVKRVAIEDDPQLAATIFYVHKNPVHHVMSTKMEDWKCSSYKAFFTAGATNVNRQVTLDFFGGLEGFRQFHQQPIYLKSAVVME